MGLPILEQNFKNYQKVQEINITVPATDIYTLKVFDGKTWHTTIISLVK